MVGHLPACGSRGVFAVDAPLDFGRFWRGETLAARRGAHPRFVNEATAVLADMRRVLGGSPDEVPAHYLRSSPFSAFAEGGGQARLLSDIPVRLYTEPDIQWWMENRKVDYYVRGPMGTAPPHSWSIVHEDELQAWLLKRVQS
jgi:hypothetical protein